MDHYESIEAQGFEVPELDIERPPDFLGVVLAKFFELHRGRRYTDSGPCPLSFGDIIAWLEFSEWETSKFEWAIIRELDSLYLRVNAETQRKNSR